MRYERKQVVIQFLNTLNHQVTAVKQKTTDINWKILYT